MLKNKGNIAVLKNNELSLLEVELKSNGEYSKPCIRYEDMRDNIGGGIEHFAFNLHLAENKIDCWCDEDGKIKNLPISVVVADRDTNIIEVINGPVVFTGNDGYGNSIPLNDNQWKILQRELSLMATIDIGNNEFSTVRLLRWDTYETRRKAKQNEELSIIKISDTTEERECNTCGKHNAGKIKIELGKNNRAIVVYMCKNCLNTFAEKIWEYLSEAEQNDTNEE